MSEEAQVWYKEKVIHGDSDQVLEQVSQGNGHSPKPDRIQQVFGPCSLKYSLNFGCSCVESGIGLYFPCGSLPAEDILRFYESTTQIASISDKHLSWQTGRTRYFLL